MPDASVDALVPDVSVGSDGLLHVAVTEAVFGDHAEMSPWLRVCPVRGTVLLCGERAVYIQRGGVMVRDATMEAGLPHDPTGPLTALVDIYGRWPDNAWLVSTDIAQLPPFETTVYRWSGRRWTVAIPGRRSMDSVATIVEWGTRGALLVEDAGRRENRARGLGARSGRRVADVEAVAPFSDGVLAVVTTPGGSGKTHALQLWPASGAPLPPVPLLAGAEADAGVEFHYLGITPVRSSEIVLYGYRGGGGLVDRDGTEEPYLARYDGKSLTPLVPPPAADVISYVEEPSGVAWALSTGKTGKTGKHAAWRREADGPWSAVAMPMPYDPASLTRTDDGAVWVLAFGPVTWREGDWITGINAALFSTRAPAHVLALGGSP